MAYTALDDSAITEHLASLNGWAREGDTITKTYTFPNYPAGIMFAGLVGAVCEAHNHHPEMFIGYKQVKVSFNTHDAGGKISAKDFETAAAIEAVGYPK
jgi:4a-hydroxytetrahydrobiopterin dehydratase